MRQFITIAFFTLLSLTVFAQDTPPPGTKQATTTQKFIYQNADTTRTFDRLAASGLSAAYYESLLSKNSAEKVNTLSDLQGYRGSAKVLIWIDELRGGVFTYVSSDVTPDEGIVFKSTNLAGFWVRQFKGDVHTAWYGVVDDGVTNQRHLVQKIIDLNYGKSIFFDKTTSGKIYIDSSLVIRNQITLKGNKNVSIYNPDAPSFQTVTPGWTSFRIENQSFVANLDTVSSNISKGDTVIAVNHPNRFTVGDRIKIRNSETFDASRAYYFKGEIAVVKRVFPTYIVIDHPTYLNYLAASAIRIDKWTPISGIVFDGLIIECGGAGKMQETLFGYNLENLTIQNCIFKNAEFFGLRIRDSKDIVVKNNRFEAINGVGYGYAVWFLGVDGATVSENYFYNNRRSVDISGEYNNGPSRNIDVHDNIVESNTSAGVSTHGGSEYIKIHDNIISNSGGGIITRSRNTSISRNQITGFSKNGGVDNYQHGIIIGENSILGNAGVNLVVENNIVNNIEGIGILTYTPLNNARINNNVLLDFKSHGIYINGAGGRDVVIKNNKIDGSSQPGSYVSPGFLHGIYVMSASSGYNMVNLDVSNNYVRHVNGSGIRINGNTSTSPLSDNITIKGNFIDSVAIRGIDLTSGNFKRVIVSDNSIYKYNVAGSADVTYTAVYIGGGATQPYRQLNWAQRANETQYYLIDPLTVTAGGTGVSTLTGLVKANGSSPFTAAVSGTDYDPPTTASGGVVRSTNDFRLGSGTLTGNITLDNGANSFNLQRTSGTGGRLQVVPTGAAIGIATNTVFGKSLNFLSGAGGATFSDSDNIGLLYGGVSTYDGRAYNKWLPTWIAVKNRVDSVITATKAAVNAWTASNTFSGGLNATNSTTGGEAFYAINSNASNTSPIAIFQSGSTTARVAFSGVNASALVLQATPTDFMQRVQTFQDKDGTVALLSDIPSSIPKAARVTGSGNGVTLSYAMPHGLSGVTSSSIISVTAKNSDSSGWKSAFADSTNITVVFGTAPPSGTNNLVFDIVVIN